MSKCPHSRIPETYRGWQVWPVQTGEATADPRATSVHSSRTSQPQPAPFSYLQKYDFSQSADDSPGVMWL